MFALLLLVFVGVSSAADPPKCCIDREFEAYLDEAGSYVSAQDKEFHPLQGYTTIALDYYSQKMSLRIHNTFDNGTETAGDLIFDYPNELEYAIYHNKCTVYKNPTPMRQPCIPDNATYDGILTMGYGLHTLDLHTWKFKHGGVDIKLSVSIDGCIPVVESIYINTPKTKTEVIYIISNFHPGIRNRKRFEIPALCNNVVPMESTLVG